LATIIDDGGFSQDSAKEQKAIFGEDVFEFPKPSTLLEKILLTGMSENDIVLDSYAGSGTTAHAVLNLNAKYGGNRKFLLVQIDESNKKGEYVNISEHVTAERVKRVINGYDGNQGTGGGFDFYEIGAPLFVGGNQEFLNEKIKTDQIQQYIWYSETRTAYVPMMKAKKRPYYLGKKDDTGYYFIYEKEALTSLDYDTLEIIKEKCSQYIVYADNCLLPKTFLLKNNITFKKIPRDITRF
jgi:adenine-specific DNA-methyltransferase